MPKIKRAAEDSGANISFSIMPWKTKRRQSEETEAPVASGRHLEPKSAGKPAIPMQAYTRMFPKPDALQPAEFDSEAGTAGKQRGRVCMKGELNSLLEAYTRNLKPQGDDLDDQGEERAGTAHEAAGHMIFFQDGTVQGGASDAGNGTKLRVRGTVIQSGRDCLRDDDWQVLELCITEEGRGAVRMLAGKSGGDAARLEAPLETHGTEEDDFRRQLATCSDRGRLSFHCSVLHEGREALKMQKTLGVHGPPKEAIVNMGEFAWDLQLGPGFSRGIEKPDDMLYDSDLDSW